MASRATSSGRVLVKLREELARGWPAGLTVLTGDDLFHLDAAQRELLATLVPDDATDFALTVYGDDKVPVGTVVSSCRSLGMFSSRRVVLVREVAALEGEPEALIDYAKQPPEESFLIVRAPSLDKRRKLHKALATKGRLLSFKAAVDARSALQDVGIIAADLGLKLDRQAAALLAQACAGDLYRVASELEKIRAWAGDEEPVRVDVETVQRVAAGGGLMSGWEVADAILGRDRPRALAAARKLVDAGDEPIRIVGGIAWQARAMLQARALLDAGRSQWQIRSRVRARSDVLNGARRYSIEELLTFPSHLLEADRTLKSRPLDSRSVLETLVTRMIGTTKGAR